MNDEDRAAFQRLVGEGGQIDPVTFPRLLANARALALARVDGVLTGVAALKRPNDAYRTRVFRAARATRTAADYPWELGWVYVAPAGRSQGLVRLMLEKLLAEREGLPVYATSAVDNDAMHRSLKRFGFEPHGEAYPPSQNTQPIQLFVSG